MAMTAALTQVTPAQFGRPATFQVAIANSGGSQVSVYSVQPRVSAQSGLPSPGCNIGPVTAPPGVSGAQVGGYQFNVPVAGSGTVYFTFQVSFYGHAVQGGPATATPVFRVDVDCLASDGSVFSALNGTLAVALSQPIFGQPPGSPPNAATPVNQLYLQNPANTQYLPSLL